MADRAPMAVSSPKPTTKTLLNTHRIRGAWEYYAVTVLGRNAGEALAEFDEWHDALIAEATPAQPVAHDDWCHTVSGCTEPNHCTCDPTSATKR